MKAQFIDVGRNKVNRMVEVKSTRELHREIKKHILSPGWGLEQAEADPDTYHVTAGWNIVGTVKIIEH